MRIILTRDVRSTFFNAPAGSTHDATPISKFASDQSAQQYSVRGNRAGYDRVQVTLDQHAFQPAAPVCDPSVPLSECPSCIADAREADEYWLSLT